MNLRNILKDILEFLGSHFLFILAICFIILIIGAIYLSLNVPPMEPTPPPEDYHFGVIILVKCG